MFAFGVMDGFLAGFLLRFWSTGGLAGGLAGGLPLGLALGLAGGLALGLVFGFSVDPEECSVTDPRRITRAILRPQFVLWLVSWLGFGLPLGLVFGLVFGLPLGLVFGLMGLLASGILVGSVYWRYLALLLFTRRWSDRWLPWRLGSFLHWCYQARLVRVAGIGYQFRHRELQDYLVRNPYMAP